VTKLKHKDAETLRLAALALSRIAARLDEKNCSLFISNLHEFEDFKQVIENIKQKHAECSSPLPAEAASQEGGRTGNRSDFILTYFLNFLENLTSFKSIRDQLDCSKMFENMVELFDEDLIQHSKISLISIIFNLNFNMTQPHELSRDFLKLLYTAYNEESNEEKTRRKIVSIVVSASALEANHQAIIKTNFYAQFKRNIN